MFGLPRTATAPFRPSQVRGSDAVDPVLSFQLPFAIWPVWNLTAWMLLAVISCPMPR